VTVDGLPCEDIPATNGQCKPDLSPLTVLELQYEFRSCDDSVNSQEGDRDGDLYSCTDEDDFNQCENLDEMLVDCKGSNNVDYFNGLVAPGAIIPIIAADETILASQLTCMITAFGASGLLNCQTVSFDTSGAQDLVLTDTFGSFALVSCADSGGNGADCFEDIIYTYTLENVGSIEMDITQALRTLTNPPKQEDLINLFPIKTLQVGQSTSISENKTIDVCTDATYEVDMYVEADPPGDINCNDTDSFKFNVTFERPCDVQIDIACALTDDSVDGTECSDIQVPIFECTNTTELRFTYEEGKCEESDHEQDDEFSCTDYECTIDGDVTILCESEGTVFCNCTVAEGGLIVITSQLVLPDNLACTISPKDSNEKCQDFVLNPSGGSGSNLNLKDKFGSLTVETCEEEGGNINNCLFDAEFTYRISNSGSSELDVTAINRTCNGDGRDLLGDADLTLSPGQAIDIQEPGRIDACAGYLEKTAYIEGVGEDGEICFDEAKFNADFLSQMPSMTPTETRLPCNITLDSVCQPPDESWLPDNQTDCALPPLQDLCSERPAVMVMRYNGGPCDQSDNLQPDKSGCVDVGDGPPTDKGVVSWITVTATKDPGITYFNGPVAVGDNFELDDGGGRVEADMTVIISEVDSSGTGPGLTIQDQFFHSSCSQNLFLKDRFGSVQLVAWLNGLQGFVTCFVDVEFSFAIVNGELGNPSDTSPATLLSFFTLTNLIGDGDGLELRNFTDIVYGKTLQPGELYEFEAIFTIDATVRRFYTAISNLVGRNDDTNGICRVSSVLSFTAGADLTPVFPTKAPTVSPTSTAFPTVDPESVDCDIDAEITCESNGKPCESSLKFPTVTCNGDVPNTMEFMFTGKECMDTIASEALKDCSDENVIPDGTESVYVYISDDKFKDGPFFSGVVSKNEIFTANVGGEGKLGIQIYNVANGVQGDLLYQEMQTDTKCETDKKQLVTADLFGALQLTGFASNSQSVSGEASITLSYSVVNNDRYKTTIDGANAYMSYETTFFPPGSIELSKRGEDYLLGTYTKDVNLFELVNQKERYSLSVTGFNSNNPVRNCSDAVAYSVEIQGDTLV